MDYRANYKATPDCISDVFDGQHYKKLMQEYVEIDGVQFLHRYFSDPHNVTLALCTDSYLLYKSK